MLKRIFESTLTMGATSAMVIVIDLVRVKCIAVMLGPTGVGVLSILNHFHSVLVILAGLGLTTGIVKYVSSYDSSGDSRELQKVLSNAWSVLFLMAAAVFLVCALFAVPMSGWFLGDKSYSFFIIIYAASMPMVAYSLVGNSLLQGRLKIGALARINILRAFLTLTLVVPLIYFFGLVGAVFSTLAGAFVHLLLTFRYVRRDGGGFKAAVLSRISPDTTKKLFHYGMSSLLAGAVMYISQLLLKTTIVQELGQRVNGIYQPIWALTMAYPTIVLSSMSAYSYPRMCGITDNREIVEELNGIVRIAFLFITPIMLVLLVARKPIIMLLYSQEFLDAAEIMHIQIMGDFLRVFIWALGMYFLPTKRLLGFIFFNVLQNVLLVAAAMLLIKPYGLHGIAWSFTLSWIPSFIYVWIHAKKVLGFSFWVRNRVLALSSFCAIVAISLARNLPGQGAYLILSFLVAALWVFLNLDRKELVQLADYLREKLAGKSGTGA